MNLRKRKLLRQRAIDIRDKAEQAKEMISEAEPVSEPVGKNVVKEDLDPKPKRKRRAYKKRKNIIPEV
tara:strand:+ start:1427 stop:1630 length:204 start_codon:yes stop_codon:yes gene_type:complete